MHKKYSYEEAYAECLKYFEGDELAAGVMVNKYLLKDFQGNFHEYSPTQLIDRITDEFHRIEKTYPNTIDRNEIHKALNKFKYIVPQGSPLFGIGNRYHITSISNCFLIESPMDSYQDIINKDAQIANIGKHRGGCGIEISKLRPRGMAVNNSALVSDGIGIFMERYSNTVKEIAQAGGRRGALLIGIDCNHCDLEEFITIKRNKNKVNGANISVKFNDAFLEAVEKNEDYVLRFPVDVLPEKAKFTKTVKARDIWNKFIESNHSSAEPGIFFWDTVLQNSLSDCYKDFSTVLANPCIAGDTVIKTSEGGRTIKDIVERYNNGISTYVLTYNENEQITEYKTVSNAILTKKETTTIRIMFEQDDNINTLECTPDHKIFTVNRGFVEAKDLTIEDTVQMLNYGKISTAKLFSVDGIVKHNFGINDVYDLTVNDNHNFYANDILVKNCGELVLAEKNSCILMALNLTGFIDSPFTEKAKINYKNFEKYTRMGMRLIDDMVDLEIEKVNSIIQKKMNDPEPMDVKQPEINLWQGIKDNYIKGRRTGLGILGLADMLAMLNIKYDSEEALKVVEDVFSKFHTYCMDEQAVLAKERGTFPVWEWEREKECCYIKILSKEVQDNIQKNGRRNISITTVAPTGSISLLTQTSSGLEPIFKRSYIRKRKIANIDLQNTQTKVSSTDADGTKWASYEVNHHGLEQWKKLNPEKDVKDSPYWKCEAGEINWKNRIKLQSIVQKYISHSCAATVNLPATTTIAEVNDIYMLAWKSKLKGVTIYREGSRQGVMTDKNDTTHVDIKDCFAPKRPPILPCNIHYSNIQGNAWIFFVGMLNGRVFEIMGGKKKNIEIPKKYKTGWTKKNGKNAEGNSTYDLYLGSLEESDDRMLIRDIISEFTPDAGSYTRMLSGMLSHGMSIKFICDQLRKDSEKAHMFCFEAGICRVLRTYIKDGETSSEDCPQCKAKLVYKDGCISCLQCGFSKCG